MAELQVNLPQLAQQYANSVLKKSRRVAKNLRRTCKTEADLVGKLERSLSRVDELQPFGVDVSSGVELYPGKKDPKKLEEFFNTLREFRSEPKQNKNTLFPISR